MSAFELILSLIMLILPDNLPSSNVGDEWTSFKKYWQIGHPAPPWHCTQEAVLPPFQECARIVSLLQEKRSYLVEEDVPIRVMN